MKDLSKLTDSEKVYEMENYIRELCEHLNWQLENLSYENFSEEFKEGK